MPTNFVIQPSSASFQEIKADLKAFIDAAPDAAKWRDFFDSSTGTKIIEVISALGAFINYDVIMARREGFRQYALNRSSVIGSAQTLGYSAFRGRNTVLKLTVLPTSTTLLTKYQVVGSVKDQDLLMVEDTAVNAGVSTQIKVIVGSLKSEDIIVNTDGPASFRFTQDKVSSDVRLFLNLVPVNTSERILDVLTEKFALITNVLGSVDAFYLNFSSFAVRYLVGNTLRLQWVELKNTAFTTDDVIFDLGTLTSLIVDSNFQDREDIESVRVNAPLFSESQFIIRGRDDYMKVLKLLNVNINSTSYVDITAAVVDLCYAQKESCLFTQAQLDNFVVQLTSARPMGLKPPTISHPNIVFLDLDVVLSLLSNEGDPTSAVEDIMKKRENVLKQRILFADLEQEIESLSFVKIGRVSYQSTTWVASIFYRLGKHVKASPDNGRIYKLVDLVYVSGSVQPTWPITLPLLQTVVDNRLVWELIESPTPTPIVWAASTRYKKGDVVAPTIPIIIPNPPGPPITAAFRVKDFINRSKASTPAVAATGSFTGATLATGFYAGTTFAALTAGTIGNSISLVFDGFMTILAVVNAWNLANPGNQVAFTPGANGSVVPAAGVLGLTGGTAAGTFGLTADTSGAAGNDIIIAFNGFKTIDTLITEYNLAHPSNTLSRTSGSGLLVLANASSLQLTGGANAVTGEPLWPGVGVDPAC